jgi:hypothetical protein
MLNGYRELNFVLLRTKKGNATMKREEAKGLLVIWVDIDDDYRLTFRMWHNCEHITERITLPGFHAAYRYEGIDRAPNYIMFYETADSKVLESGPYLHSVNNPSPGTKDAIAHFKNPVRTIYILLGAAGRKPPVVSPYIFVVRFNLREGADQEAIAWYKNDYLPKISTVPGVHRARLYGVDPSVSKIMSTERKIFKPEIVEQKFLCLYEIASLDLPASRAWSECQTGAEQGRKIEKVMEHVVQERYWLDFTMPGPEGD